MPRLRTVATDDLAASCVVALVVQDRSALERHDVNSMLHELLDRGGTYAASVGTLLPVLQTHVLRVAGPNSALAPLALLQRIVKIPVFRAIALRNASLWRTLSLRMVAPQEADAVARVVDAASAYASAAIAPVVDRLCELVFCSRARSAALVHMAEVCAAVPFWSDRFTHALAGAVPHVECIWGGIVRNLLVDNPSVLLLLSLSSDGVLDAFVDKMRTFANTKDRTHAIEEARRVGEEVPEAWHRNVWAEACATFVRSWPTRFGESPRQGDDEATTTVECPITLQPCVDPVVASDGHTYERDAILKHMLQNGLVSPLTRQALEGRLVPNRAVRRASQHGA